MLFPKFLSDIVAIAELVFPLGLPGGLAREVEVGVGLGGATELEFAFGGLGGIFCCNVTLFSLLVNRGQGVRESSTEICEVKLGTFGFLGLLLIH